MSTEFCCTRSTAVGGSPAYSACTKRGSGSSQWNCGFGSSRDSRVLRNGQSCNTSTSPTAMGVEALRGTAESFHPFFSVAYPHYGQTESAATILSFLQGSKLAHGLNDETNETDSGLAQDRYALRTASQCMGPLHEDLQLAYRQLTTELNSTTDNPLIDPEHNTIYHGGNFQASSVTSALDKIRNAL